MTTDVTRILSAIEHGDPSAAGQLLPLVYDELRQLAEQRLGRERAGQTLQPTALVHEAFIRLVDVDRAQHFNSKGHFFAACAEAMRRILVDNARRKNRDKHGGHLQRLPLEDYDGPAGASPDDILALDAALTRLAEEDPEGARLVQLHFFAGLPIEQAADQLGVSRATAYRQWLFARAWLRCAIDAGGDEASR
jgi:RNA polymerase sigma factor (TIGR02999 family)